jgi:hypothetical protein
MEGFGHIQTIDRAGKGLVVAATVIGLMGLSPDARADHHYRDVTSSASSNKAGVDFSIREVNSESGHAVTGASGVRCDLQLLLGNMGQYSGYWKRSPSETSVLGHRVCTDGTDEVIWVDTCDFMSLDVCPSGAGPLVDPVVLAQRVRDRLPVPGLAIASNPRRGLVGLKSWFWIEGGGRPLSDSLSAFGVTIEVEARPVSYRWDFGDGTVMTTKSPGRPYPERSPVKHLYERSSAEQSDGYVVSVTTVFDVRWRANGGRWRTLSGISRVSERSYRVAESQAVNSDD